MLPQSPAADPGEELDYVTVFQEPVEQFAPLSLAVEVVAALPSLRQHLLR